VTIVDFLNSNHDEKKKPYIKVPGLAMSAREYKNVSSVFKNVPDGIDAKILMTLRHVQHGAKVGSFTKC
jgi:hypothetical protein